MKPGILTAILMLGAAAAGADDLQVLWDQPGGATSGAEPLADASFGCAPEARTVHLASDFRLEAAVTLGRITTHYTADAPEAFAATAEAWLWISPKSAAVPEAGADPRRAGRLVPVLTRRDGDHVALVATDLAIPLRAGDYWIALTPVVPAGTRGAGGRLRALRAWGAASAAFEPCGARLWTGCGAGVDGTLRIEGVVEAASEAAVGGGPWPWRELR